VDPLAGFPLEGFGDLLADPNIEKIFHSSEYDLILLKREFDWNVANLFDTLWAARVLGFKNMGLAWFLREFYEVVVSKKHQKADWSKRPLTPDMLDYAQKDTHFLLRLRDDLADQLQKAGRYEEALEIFSSHCSVRLPETDFDPERYRTIRGARELSKRGQAVLRQLFIYRDSEARRRDTPPFKVVGNEVLLRLAQERPKHKSALTDIKGLTPRMIGHMADGLLAAIDTGCKAPLPKQQRTPRRRSDPETSARYEILSDWRKESARQRGVESDVILPREAMWEIAQSADHTLESLARVAKLGPQRISLHGEAIIEAMSSAQEDKPNEEEATE
jgi:ribonuclease D